MPQNFMGLLQIDEGIRDSCHQMYPTPFTPTVVTRTTVFYQTPQCDNTSETSAFPGTSMCGHVCIYWLSSLEHVGNVLLSW